MTPDNEKSLTNVEVAVYALYLTGGASQYVHTEIVALKAFELAPDSFSWVSFPEHPDKEVARIALADARKEKSGNLVIGRAGRGKGVTAKTGAARTLDGWQLTEGGVKWITANEERLVLQLQQSLPKTHRQEALAKVAKLRKHKLFREYLSKPQGYAPTLGALAELLRCRVDADTPIWKKRFDSLRNLAIQVDQQDVVEFLGVCASFLEKSKE
jgi:hypothetical protein